MSYGAAPTVTAADSDWNWTGGKAAIALDLVLVRDRPVEHVIGAFGLDPASAEPIPHPQDGKPFQYAVHDPGCVRRRQCRRDLLRAAQRFRERSRLPGGWPAPRPSCSLRIAATDCATTNGTGSSTWCREREAACRTLGWPWQLATSKLLPPASAPTDSRCDDALRR